MLKILLLGTGESGKTTIFKQLVPALPVSLSLQQAFTHSFFVVSHERKWDSDEFEARAKEAAVFQHS